MYQVIKHRIDPFSAFGWYIKPKKKRKALFSIVTISVLLFLVFNIFIRIKIKKSYTQIQEVETLARIF